MARYLIGIDLGTTNSALAYVDLRRSGSAPEVQTFAIPQLVAPGELGRRPLLPSFLYLPGPHDLPAGAAAVPWDPARDYIVGEFARNHGARVAGRLVASAKSWLCHAGVDRTAALLPWTAPPDVPRLSPVEASARYLRHLVESWNWEMARDRPEDRLEKQAVVLTVPASFDDVARNLTVEAARRAGLENLTLLEEPQAAFYCCLSPLSAEPGRANEASRLQPGAQCLVVDVGGGTSDFSLIRAIEQEGDLAFVREAVGDHLLLGGDNMDLALAKFVEGRLPGTGRLDATQYGLLTQACRLAKEALLGPAPPASFTVTVVGRGRQVVGGAVHASLTAAEVRQVLFDGFLPQVPADAQPVRGPRTGLHEMGLPYVSDPAITRHLAAFLSRHATPTTTPSAPQAILFNGGVFQPAPLRQRLLEVMRQWYDRPGQPWQPVVLASRSLDLAVAWGAAYYAWLRHTGGRRIGGGIARSYYVGLASPEGPAADAAGLSVLCVVPQHLEEGAELVLERPQLELALGQPVRFALFTSTVRGQDKAGEVLRVQPGQLLQLPPLHTVLRGGKRAGVKHVPVTLAARSTEIGTLELYCVAREGGNRWRLEFNVRDLVPEEDEASSPAPTVTDVFPEALVQEAGRLIRGVYDGSLPDLSPQELTKSLETALEHGRERWPTGLCRRLWDFLREVADQRRRSQGHQNRWFNLAGFCLRPGFGDPLDRYRVEQLWKLLHASSAPAAPGGSLAGGADYWIMWRRVAGGLHPSLQRALYDRLRPVLLPGKGRAVKPAANELTEMWRAVASLERLDSKQKEALGQVLLKPLRRSPAPPYSFWALTRLGARRLLYGPLNCVLHPQVVESWLEVLLSFEPTHESEQLAWAFCLAQLARRTGQRALDLSDESRQRVLEVLRGLSVPVGWVQMVEEVTASEGEEQSRLLGDSLPIGLRLAPSEE